MARIPEHEIERLKREVSVQRLAEGRGIELKRHGAELLGLCPFHDDKEPSLAINPKKNIWNCLGACQCGGSAIDWTMKAEGVSFRHAVELLQADHHPSLVAGVGSTSMQIAGALPPGAPAYRASMHIKRSTVKRLPTALEHNAEDAKLLRQVIDYYHEALKQSPEALAYLEKRGISGEAIEQFKLGFANRTLGYRLPEKNRKEGAAIRGQLQRIGILRASGHEHFTGSIVFPVINESGQVLEIYGRKINDNLRKGTPKHLYLPGPHQGIWNAEALKASPEIILCESLIDALTFWCAGYRNVTASYGIEGFTADHLAAFKEHGTERILIAYDRDKAGEQAAESLSKKLIAEGIDCYRIHVPKGMDVNEYALQVQPASKSLGVVIRSAQWLGAGKAPGRSGSNPEPALNLQEPKPKVENHPVATASPASETLPSLVAEEPTEPLPAAVVPKAPTPTVDADIKDNEIIITLGDRRYRIRGLEKNLAYDVMKINLLVSRPTLDGAGDTVHVDTFDLYQQRPRGAFIKQAAVELGVKDDTVKADLGKLLLKLEALQSENIQAAQAPKDKAVTLNDEETRTALELLKSPDLLARIGNDFTRCGVVGETTNKLVGYLAAISRKLDSPLAITIQSTSAAGKSVLMDAVLAFMPEEDRIKYSAMTGQSLFYMGETDLQHKVLAIVEEEGASNASYALKLLQSEGELTIASTGKDPITGELKTQDYQVKGPVMIMLTTTAIDIDEELLNRCIVLTVDEGRQQTKAIHAIQRDKRTLSGLLAKADKQTILTLHQNAQRLLQPLAVVNPYAKHLSFIDDRTRTRRDHEKYLTLIDTLALLHQHQRPIKSIHHGGQSIRYVEVALEDIETANHLAHEVLGRTLDELPPQTRKLLGLIVELVADRCKALEMRHSDYRFSRRDIRTFTGWSDGQLKIHCRRLTELEYLLVHRGGRGQCIEYELLYDGAGDDHPHLMGLIDLEKLRAVPSHPCDHGTSASCTSYDVEKAGAKPQKTAPSQGQVSPKSAPSQGGKNGHKVSDSKASSDLGIENTEKVLLRPSKGNGSYDGQEVLVSRAQGCAGATRNDSAMLVEATS
ncbi:DNA primase, phage associated [hydrothermal vent metagenome]|uniref:DNA primase, phage associated n=1 Tax=hydrothermal vent metagenome TaxID=652676 RepID=A0A3B1AV94_9ZZZZ